VEKDLIESLCCPVCVDEGALLYSDAILACSCCGRQYPNVQGRPVLVSSVADEAEEGAELLNAASALETRELASPRDYSSLTFHELFFGRLFRKFDSQLPHWAFLGRKVKEMVRMVPDGARVLDIGAGECKYEALFSHCRYVGTDLVFSSDKHDFSRIDVIADACALPFREKSFDAALNLVVIEHVPDPIRTVREMARILKPGGVAFALVPLVRPEHLVPFDFQRFTRYGIERLFEHNGFEIASIEGSNGALWTAVHYADLITRTQPLLRYGRRSLRGILINRFWAFVFWPLVLYARVSDRAYGGEFPIYFWVRAVRKEDGAC
jgi:SAM-dependent methyltransferase/uncharacterized protein YbaR (Trm112 family)